MEKLTFFKKQTFFFLKKSLKRGRVGVFRTIRIKSNCKIQKNKNKQERKFSTTSINDRQLSSQKIRQKISAIKTNSFDGELFTFDDNKKIVHFGISIHVLS